MQSGWRNSLINISIHDQQDQREWINRKSFCHISHIISGEDVIWSELMRRSWVPIKMSQPFFFFLIFPFTYRYFPIRMNFCKKSLHSHISTLTTTSLQHLKSLLPSKKYFLLHGKLYQKPVSLINKLQLLSYQSKSNITPRLPLHTSQPTPKIYNTTALLRHA